tara:strand:+ start:846 stop:1409 length:564 start_codon:yes stop_codon:yes gene_type:complete
MSKSTQITIGIFAILIILYFLNHTSQSNLTLEGTSIFSGNNDDVYRFLIVDGNDSLELIRNDSTWTITQADTLVIKNNQIEKLFDRVLKVKKEFIVSKNPEKWSTFGVIDSLGRQLSFFNKNNKNLGSYVFGNEGQDYQHNYIREKNGKDVFRTNDNVYFLLNSGVTYWGKNPPKPEINDIDTTSAS